MSFNITINADKEYVKKIRNIIDSKGGYCPYESKKTNETKCICKKFINKNKSGWCDCLLYYKEVYEEMCV